MDLETSFKKPKQTNKQTNTSLFMCILIAETFKLFKN